MEHFIAALPAIISGCAVVLLGCIARYVVNQLTGFRSEHEALLTVKDEHEDVKTAIADIRATQDAQNEGIRAVLRAMMVQEHKRLVHQGFATPDEKEHFEQMYHGYTGVDGNGTGTALYKDVMAMYTMAKNTEGTNNE